MPAFVSTSAQLYHVLTALSLSLLASRFLHHRFLALVAAASQSYIFYATTRIHVPLNILEAATPPFFSRYTLFSFHLLLPNAFFVHSSLFLPIPRLLARTTKIKIELFFFPNEGAANTAFFRDGSIMTWHRVNRGKKSVVFQ